MRVNLLRLREQRGQGLWRFRKEQLRESRRVEEGGGEGTTEERENKILGALREQTKYPTKW